MAYNLEKLNIDPSGISVSGISAGGYMAVQLHVAYSSIFSGAAVFAAGPYFCSEGKKYLAEKKCMQISEGLPDYILSAKYTFDLAAKGLIDPTINMCDDKIFIFSGKRDSVVKNEVVRALEKYYSFFVKGTNIEDFLHDRAEHCMPVSKTERKLINPCEFLGLPFIGMCSYDGAGEALKHIYEKNEKLNPPVKPSSEIRRFSQKDFFLNSKTMHEFGHVYIPEKSLKGEKSFLHVALHGCFQTTDYINDEYIEFSGYNEWAEANNIVILYPQVKNIPELNTAACWDWWGYESNDFCNKNGTQIKSVMAMIERLSGIKSL